MTLRLINDAFKSINQEGKVNFCDWSPNHFKVLANSSEIGPVSGVESSSMMLTNCTAISSLLKIIFSKF